MYRPFFGFARPPFERDLPADQLFRAPALDELHARLCYLAETRGIGVVHSEPGCGKTTALRRFKEALHPDQVRIVYLHDTSVNAADLYRQLALELGIEPHWSRAMTFRAIQQEVVRLAAERRLTVLLIIDEAHRLRADVLAELPLLTNFEWDSGARLALLLCGQVGLRQRLRMADLEALNQRITVRYALRGLDREATRLYLEHRLRVAGVDRPVFSEPAIEALFNASQGVFRRIDALAHNALGAAAAARARIVDADHVVSAAEELRA
jgi:type II secretory pathway predicted ATPase ExeA